MAELLPAAPALVAGAGQAVLLEADGVFHHLPAATAAAALRRLPPPLVVHAPATFRRLGLSARPAFDLLELFAFVCPACPAAPTVRGMALALGDPVPTGLEAAAALLPRLASLLLRRLAGERALSANAEAAGLAALMGQAGWGWAPFVLAALGAPAAAASAGALSVWRRLSEWEEGAPPPKPLSHPLAPGEVRARLARMVGEAAEPRPGQSDYAAAVSEAFAPREATGEPRFVLAEAGTGTGKTLGYIAPASLWAEKNHGSVWISTFTRHLQRQVEAEVARLYPERAERRRHVVVRKGRENYLCLLNFQEITAHAASRRRPQLIALGLIARWAEATVDGDLNGGDLPGWLTELFGPALFAALADRRGECIHAACPHWRRCFIEHNIRRARRADLVIANHALVLTQGIWGGPDEAGALLRTIFDEGHHLFDAADAAFAVAISGTTMAELRRWLLGAEGGRSRARGLALRIADLLGDTPEMREALDGTLRAARALPAPGWQARLERIALDGNSVAIKECVNPLGQTVQSMFRPPEHALAPPDAAPDIFALEPAEALLAAVAAQVMARAGVEGDAPEADLWPVSDALAESGKALSRALAALSAPLSALAAGLSRRLADEAESLDELLRLRIEAMARVIVRRALQPLTGWREVLRRLSGPAPDAALRPEQITFLRLERRDGAIRDAALLSHWLDPTVPFAAALVRPAHGLLVTSATLRDAGAPDAESAWHVAEARTGAAHLGHPALRVSVQSPFDYRAQTRVFVVTDLAPGRIPELAAAYRVLFVAAGGGALGLFTAISRLRAVYPLLAPALEEVGIPLYAQHVDPMNNATLVEIFRQEEESCLLGTDAMRDGVDVPGRALRLVVFEKVPWARPDILHRERRRHLSEREPQIYDERMARLRLRQAFGRLIRTASDRGAFVLLDRRTPSRLYSAFPEGVVVQRAGLAEVAAGVRRFLGQRIPVAAS
ncbi:MAG: ATP-dependent DNA helicase [Acetobacteraceae bacterium]